MVSLLVSNDFPPKLGGIQSYLHELWRRLPPTETTVMTASYPGARQWDARQSFRVEREHTRVLLPTRGLVGRVEVLAAEVDADVVLVDPMLPLGLIGRRLRSRPHVVITHGAEVTVPGRLPGSNLLARSVLRDADAVIAAGAYPARIATEVAGRSLRGVQVPPGVDTCRFRPLDRSERRGVRARFDLAADRPLVLGVSRLVPRKGFDVVIEALARLDDSIQLAIAGSGRDSARLASLARRHGVSERVRFLGRVSDADLPALYGCADVFAMICRDRWAGLEAEGFGIVFLEAAASGVPAVAGRSGGSHEAVLDGETGFVVEPRDVREAAAAIERIVGDDELRARLGSAARERAETAFSYDFLVSRLEPVCRGDLSALGHLVES